VRQVSRHPHGYWAAQAVIDYTQEDDIQNGQRYDLILDVVARRSMWEWRRALKPAGAYVMLGASTRLQLQGTFFGPLISMTGSRKMAVMWRWKPLERTVRFGRA